MESKEFKYKVDINMDPTQLISRNIRNKYAFRALNNTSLKYYQIDIDETITISKKKEEFLKELNSINGRIVSESTNLDIIKNYSVTRILQEFNNTTLSYLLGNTGVRSMLISGTNKEEVEKIKNLILNYADPIPPTCHVYSLTSRGDNLCLTTIGRIEKPLIRENYNEFVLNEVDHVISDLKNPNPCGKLTIIDGPPGTGKSSLIESLLILDNLTFIIVPSHQLISWGNPALLNLLLEQKQKNKNQMVFIIEDADECLVNRDNGNSNKNAISTLLNMSDGILGSVLDLRIIVTTNASIQSFDPAIVRDSRLCRRIEIGELSVEMANKVYQRLTNTDKNPFSIPATLAEVYKLSKSPNEEVKQDKKKIAKVGFIK